MSEPTLPPPKKSVLIAIGAGLLGLAVFVGLFMGFYYDEVPRAPADVMVLGEEVPAAEWKSETGFNLAPVGALPSLQAAMRENSTLRTKVDAFEEKDDAQLFANFRKTDADIAEILLLWAGADMSQTQKTREGFDPRVDRFLRRAFSLGSAEPIINNPRLGRDPWARLFGHYKARLLAQAEGGAAPFNGELSYSVGRDRLRVENKGLNKKFFQQFGAFIKDQKDGNAYRANLLAYIRAVDASLLKDSQTLALIR